MPNKKLILNAGRQWPLYAEQVIDFDHLAEAGVAVKVLSIPRNATIIAGDFLTVTPFAGGTIKVGTKGTPDAYGSPAVAAVGKKPLTLTDAPVGEAALFITPSAAMTAGKGILRIGYLIADRANEAQP